MSMRHLAHPSACGEGRVGLGSLADFKPKSAPGLKVAIVRERSPIARPSHRLCARGSAPSDAICLGNDALLCVGP